MIGDELALDPDLGFLEKMYIKLFGVPINGLRIRLRRILPAINGLPKKILDGGCGKGIFSYQLAKRFPQASITAIDLDENQLQKNRFIAEQAKLDNLTFTAMDVSKLPYDEEFDLILSVDNIEHVDDDDAVLSGFSRALMDGGKLVLHIPAYERRWGFYHFKVNFDVPGHFRPGYVLEDIINKVEVSGLAVTKAQYTYGLLENLSNNISYSITKADARNKFLYAFVFPLLNLMSFLGRNTIPHKGAGILLIAKKNTRQ